MEKTEFIASGLQMMRTGLLISTTDHFPSHEYTISAHAKHLRFFDRGQE
ncbi:hypothetical protein [Peribacillus butanolivorans]|nr:hypothetical protein [Peribacillus butanolivorans]